MSRKSFTDSTGSNIEADGHTLVFLANSGTVMTNGLAVDLDTLTAPISDGSLKLVKDLTDDDKLTVPLLVDHWPSIDHQAGTVTKLWLDDTGLMASAKLSDVAEGQLVQQLAKDGALTNSFSITVDFATEPGRDGIIHDAELVEISVVYRGADSKAAFRSLNKRGMTMGKKNTVQVDMRDVEMCMKEFGLTSDEAKKLLDSIQQAMQAATDNISKAVAGATDPDDDNGSNDDSGDQGTPTPKGGDEPQPPQSSSDSRKKGAKGMPQLIFNMANNQVPGDSYSMAKTAGERKSYLDSPQAFNDYAKFIFAHPTEGLASDVTAGWSQFARKKLNEHASFGIDTDDVDKLIPTSVVQSIEDVFNTRGSGLWAMLNHTGLDVPPVLGANEVGLDGDNGRAHGYPVANYGSQKQEEKIKIQTRKLAIDYVYKYITLHKGDIRRTQNPGALLKYVLQELPNRIIQTIERAIVLNRAAVAANDWPDMAMFRSVLDDSLETQQAAGEGTIAGQQFASTRPVKDGESLIEAFRRASGTVKAAGQKVLITSSDTLADIQFSKDKNGDWLLPLGADPATAIGVNQIITPEWYFDRDKQNALGVIMVPSQYSVFGDDSIEAFTNFALRTNMQEYLQEVYTGGGLTTVRSACVVPPAQTTPASQQSEAPAQVNGQGEQNAQNGAN